MGGFFEFFEDATLLASTVDGRFQFFAQFGEPLQALCVGKAVGQGVLERHSPAPSMRRPPPLVVALILQNKSKHHTGMAV